MAKKKFKNTYTTPESIGTVNYEVISRADIDVPSGRCTLTFDLYNNSDEKIDTRDATFVLPDNEHRQAMDKIIAGARDQGMMPDGTDTDDDDE